MLTVRRWGAPQVLASLHMMAEHVVPPAPSEALARRVYRNHNYDKHVNLSDLVTQREFSLVAAWERLLAHVAHHVEIGPDDWAAVFEDDIALHDELSHAAARRALLHGMELARSDGLLYLGICQPWCHEDSVQEAGGVRCARPVDGPPAPWPVFAAATGLFQSLSCDKTWCCAAQCVSPHRV